MHDSGCTQYMTGDPRMFNSINENKSNVIDSITFGDNGKGKCQCGTHRIPHKEERRSSLTRILPHVILVVVLFCNPTRNSHCKPTRILTS